MFLFGSMLYFYGDLDNPVTEGTLYFLYKDIFGILTGVIIILTASRLSIPKETILWLFFYIFLTLYVFLYSSILGQQVGNGYLRLFKNGLIYIGFYIPVLTYILRKEGIEYLVRVVIDALILAFVVSILFHAFSPTTSITGRLFGTFGSPNSAGYAAGFAITLVFVSRNLMASWQFRDCIALFLACIVLTLTASIGSIVGVLLFAITMAASQKKIVSIWLFNLLALLMLVASSAVYFVFLSQSPGAPGSELVGRIISISSQGFENDALAIRLGDFYTSLLMLCDADRTLAPIFGCLPSDDFRRYDSVLMSFIFNFGYITTFIFVFLVFSPVFFVLINHKSKNENGELSLGQVKRYQKIKPLIHFMLTFVPINMILQHSFDIFPTNFMFAVIFTILYAYTAEKTNAISMGIGKN